MNEAQIAAKQEKQAEKRLQADIAYMIKHNLTEDCKKCIHRAAGACEYVLDRGCKDYMRKAG